MGFWQRLLSGPATPPLLFRLRGPSGLAEGDVAVRGIRDGSGVFELRRVAAQGVVLVPWPGGSRAEFLVQNGAAAARVLLTRAEASTGRVHEIVLHG
jgi:hypothetical protein